MAAGYSVTYTVVDQATAKINDINKKIQALRAPLDQQAKSMSKFLDVSGLQKVSDGFSAIARTSADAFSSISRIVPVMGAITGAATVSGLVALVKNFTDLGYTLERTADYLGTTAGSLQQWQNATKLAGGNVDDLTESMKELAKSSYDAALGRAPEALQRFARAGISLRDSNGHIKTATELMPQVLNYINSFANAQDRETVAVQLGGKALYELNEDFRLSGKSYKDWLESAKGFGAIMDPKTLQQYRQAVGELDVAFTGLGTEITQVAATALTPLIKQFAEWVHTHQPEIIKAINEIANTLVWVGEHAKTIAEVFAIAWGVKAVAGVVSLIAQVRALDAALSGGLLGKLGMLGLAAAGAMKFGRDVQQGPPEFKGEWGINKWLNPAWLLHKAIGGGDNTAPSGPSGTAPVPPAGTTGPAPAGTAPSPPAGTAPSPPAGTAPPAPAGTTGPAPAADAAGAAGGGGAAFIKSQEGPAQLTIGNDVGHPVIGYGHDITPQEQKQGFIDTPTGRVSLATGRVTAADAESIFQQDYQSRRAHLAATVPGFSGLNANQQGALTSYYYNTGRLPQGLAGNIASGNTGAIAESLRSGIATAGGQYLPALARRRAGEARLFNSPVSPTPDTAAQNAGPPHTPGGGKPGDVVGQMVALAGTRGAAVREFLKDPSGKIARDPDLGLWCAEFTQAYLRHTGITGPDGGKNLLAASFQNWGHEVAYKDVQRGDVLVNRNLKHVGVATGQTRINPETGAFEVQEVSSNSIVNGKVTNLPGLRWRSDVAARRSDELAALQAQGSPMSVAAANGKPANGSVDITVTHKNAPPGTTVAANATGDGVNLAGPRVEQQQMSAP